MKYHGKINPIRLYLNYFIDQFGSKEHLSFFHLTKNGTSSQLRKSWTKLKDLKNDMRYIFDSDLVCECN